MLNIFIIALISAFAITYFSSHAVIYLVGKYSIFDMPGERKIHTHPVLTLGGLSFIFTFYIMIIGGLIIYPQFAGQILLHNLTALIVSQILIVGLGIYDDLRGLSAGIKFTIQLGASVILIYFLGFSINIITNPFGGEIHLGIFSVPITILWLVGITNAINLLDGLDGLAAGIVLISSLFLSFVSLYLGQNGVALLFIILASSLLAFLKFNFYKARIFMGDTGSMFLGFTIAVLSLLISMKTTVSLSLMVPIISLGIPIMDTSVSFFRRLLKKDNPFRGDKLHIHHILLQSGLSHHHVVILVWVITLLFNIIALCFMLIPGRYSLLILLIFASMVATGIMFLEFIKREKISIK